jgi:prepilin-type N-terminal cleavage/methylation domain-containing protein
MNLQKIKRLIVSESGFTLIELLVVIGVLTVLLSITLVAINPRRQLQQANDTQRRNDVNAILNAIHQYASDNQGTIPSAINATAKTIQSNTAAANTINLCSTLIPTYIADMPIDPTTGTKSPSTALCTDSGTTYSSGYTVATAGGTNRIQVCATGEITSSICVTR